MNSGTGWLVPESLLYCCLYPSCDLLPLFSSCQSFSFSLSFKVSQSESSLELNQCRALQNGQTALPYQVRIFDIPAGAVGGTRLTSDLFVFLRLTSLFFSLPLSFLSVSLSLFFVLSPFFYSLRSTADEIIFSSVCHRRLLLDLYSFLYPRILTVPPRGPPAR